VDGVLTMQPSTCSVSPVRSASASSMQSPPAKADAVRVSSLSPSLARPGASPRSTWVVHQLAQSQMVGQSDQQDQPGIGHQAAIVEAILMRSGCCVGSILLGAPCSRVVLCFKNYCPRSREHLLIPSARRHPNPFGGLGFNPNCTSIGIAGKRGPRHIPSTSPSASGPAHPAKRRRGG